MKIAVRYQSLGGNTKSVAKAIANAAGVKAEPITVPLDEPVDVLFIGGGVYMWGLDDSLKSYLEQLDIGMIKTLAAFSTAGGVDGAKKIVSIATERGIPVHSEMLPMKIGVKNHGWISHKGGFILSDKQLAAVNDFVDKVTV